MGRRRRFTAREIVLSLALLIVSCLSLTNMVLARKIQTAESRTMETLAFQPSEIAADNFPGSAFYYLDQDVGVLNADEADRQWEQTDGTDLPVPTPASDSEEPAHLMAAHAFRMTGNALDRARALQCMTTAIYYEAALEPDAGQQAVAQVILNRVAHPSYPNTVCGVIYQGSERVTGCQFSFSCDGSMSRAPSRLYWLRAARVAQKALDGQVYAPAGLATHYHTTEVHPYWAPSLSYISTIGAHRFYKWKGLAGQRSAFAARYVGGEPLPQPKPRVRNAAVEPMADPIELARAYETARRQAVAEAERQMQSRHDYEMAKEAERLGRAPSSTFASPPIPAPSAYANPASATRSVGGSSQKLPGSGSVKAEYENSGRWIGTPTQ